MFCTSQLIPKGCSRDDHVKVNIRGMGIILYMMCMHGVYISQNNRAICIRVSDMKVTCKSGTLTSISAVCDDISKDHVKMTIQKLHSQI